MNVLDLELIQIKMWVMKMINRVVLVGRLTRDPELRRTNNGTAVTSFTLAVNRTFQSSDGQAADFINCVVWNKLAENVELYCFKGSLVGVEGRLRSRSYDNAQGQKVFVVEVVCDSVQFLESKRNGTSQQNQSHVEPVQHQQGHSQQVQGTNWYDSNVVQDNQNSFDGFNIMEDDIQF